MAVIGGPVLFVGSCPANRTRAEAVQLIAAGINEAHKATRNVVCFRLSSMLMLLRVGHKSHASCRISSQICLVENMAGQGNVIGGSWEDLRDIIALVKDKCVPWSRQVLWKRQRPGVSFLSLMSSRTILDFFQSNVFTANK